VLQMNCVCTELNLLCIVIVAELKTLVVT